MLLERVRGEYGCGEGGVEEGGGVEERRVARGVLRAEALDAGALHSIGGCFMSQIRADVTVH